MSAPPPYPTQGEYRAAGAEAPPPAAYAYVPPPDAQQPSASVTNVQEPPKQEKKGLFGSFMKEADKVGKQIGKQLDAATHKINEAADKNWVSALLDFFKNGNVVQLVSRATGLCVQVVLSPQGTMVLDAMGPCDPNAANSKWTVTNEGNNQVRLSNANNYLAVENGCTIVKPFAPGSALGPETKFQLSQIQMQFVTLEPLQEKGKYVGFFATGQLRPATECVKKDFTTEFGVKLVSTAYPAVAVVKQ